MKTIRLYLMVTVVLLAGATPSLAQYGFDIDAPPSGAVAGLVQLHSFENVVTNTGSVSDTYEVTIVRDVPGIWVASLCEGTICYPPTLSTITFTLAPGEHTDLLVDITALADEGQGTATITVSSQGQPSLSQEHAFTLITSGLDVLLVDGDGGLNHETYFQNALTAAGQSVGTWQADGFGALAAQDLTGFGTIVWALGTGTLGLTPADLPWIQSYLQGGGQVIVSGQNAARDFCSPSGVHYSPDNRVWFRNVLGVDFVLDDTNDSSLTGASGDPVAAGLSVAINGGTGANNNTEQDEISAVGPGASSLLYAAGRTGAVRATHGQGRSFFLGFSFEGISSSSVRNTLMSNALNWLALAPSAAPESVPALFAQAPKAAPNPFNPATHLVFEVGGQRAVQASVEVFDLRGRQIRTLHRGLMQPGSQDLLWDGRDDRGRVVGGGTYLALIRLEDRSRTLKLTLAK